MNWSAGVLSKSKFKLDPFLCRTTDRGIVKTKKLAKELHPLNVLATFFMLFKNSGELSIRPQPLTYIDHISHSSNALKKAVTDPGGGSGGPDPPYQA